MTDSEFLALAEHTLDQIERALEQASSAKDLDLEFNRSGNVLEIEFLNNGSKIIINSQTPMQEMWVAAKAGGFHYKYYGTQWLNTRGNSELFTALSQMISTQAEVPLTLQLDA